MPRNLKVIVTIFEDQNNPEMIIVFPESHEISIFNNIAQTTLDKRIPPAGWPVSFPQAGPSP